MDKDIIKDFGSIKVPESWDEITLKKYEEIERYYDDKEKGFNLLDVLDILIDKDRDYIMSLPSEFLNKILEKLSFMESLPEVGESSNKIEIDGEEYVINIQSKLKTGEYIAADAVLKADRHNYAAILAILARKDGEAYDSRFENEVVEERIKLFESQPITKIWKVISFFLNLYLVLEIPTRLSLKVKEGISLIASDIENLEKSGQVSKRSMKSAMKKLKKLEQSIKCI